MEIPSNTFELLTQFENALRSSSVVAAKTVVNALLEINFIAEGYIRGALKVHYTHGGKALVDEFESVDDIPACIQNAIDTLQQSEEESEKFYKEETE
jgi:hypothetical protein